MKILVTGGTGYIGSHTVVELLNSGYDIAIVDNLCNSKADTIDRIEEITKIRPSFYNVDCKNLSELEIVFEIEKPEAVIHFAGLKAVEESIRIPIEYYENNIVSTLNVLKLMKKYGCKNIVFSSSATVYSDLNEMPVDEEAKLGVTNPYGRTKLMIENILRDAAEADKELNIAILRYFNPLGAHKSGLIGENPNGIPNNLMPYILKVAKGVINKTNEILTVYGKDYETYDGTCIRDYIHVLDLACGHLLALNKLKSNPGVVTYNLGTGKGYSVLDVVNEMKKTVGFNIPYIFGKRRDGDIPTCYAIIEKAKKELGFFPKYGIKDMCEDSWNYAKKNKQ